MSTVLLCHYTLSHTISHFCTHIDRARDNPLGTMQEQKHRMPTEGLLHLTKIAALVWRVCQNHTIVSIESDPFPVKQEGGHVADRTSSERTEGL